MPINGSVCGRAYRTSQPELVNETETCDYFYRVPITEEIRSIIAIPVEVKDRVIAVLAATSTVAHAFSQDDLRILEAIGAQLGVAMENARLYEAEREQRKLLEQSQLQLIQSEKLAATGQLAASLAHEINNPLQAIRTGIQLSQALAEPSSQQREYLDMADRELQRLTNLVNHTLDFARRPQPEGQPVNVNRVLKQVFALASKYLQHRHVVLRTDLLPDPPDVVTSPGQLGQVFLNLILNAVDAMPEGGTLRVSSHLQDGGLAVRFIDTGHGIEPDNMDKIFEPFFSTKQDGTGLGLPISRTILQRHDGTIDVTSTVGEGTTFEVWLPQPPTAATERSVS
jgi:signal transduction histidine kinase